MAITFHNEDVKFVLKDKTQIKSWAKQIIEKEGRGVGEINYVFCSDEYLLEINQTYLQHDTYTDIITFDYSEGNKKLSGDIFISIDRIKENAEIFKVSFQEEFLRVFIHGILHLLGYKDKTKTQEAEMRSKENECLQVFFGMK